MAHKIHDRKKMCKNQKEKMKRARNKRNDTAEIELETT